MLSGALKFDGFIGDGGATGGGPAAWLAPAFVPELGEVMERGGGEVQREGARIAVRIGRPEDPAREPEAPPARGRRRRRARRRRRSTSRPPAPARRSAALSYSSLGEYAHCGYRFYAERVLGLPPVPEPRATAEPYEGPRSAADRGVLLHALLEGLDFRRPVMPNADAVTAAAAQAGLHPPPGPAEADELAALVRRFAAERAVRPPGPRHRRSVARSASPSRWAPIPPSRSWSAPSTCWPVSRWGGCSWWTTRATGWPAPSRRRS